MREGGNALRIRMLAAATILALTVVLVRGSETSLANRVLLPMFDGDLSAWAPDSSLVAVPEYESDDAIVGSVSVEGGGEQHRSLDVPVGAAAWGPAGWPLIYIPKPTDYHFVKRSVH